MLYLHTQHCNQHGSLIFISILKTKITFGSLREICVKSTIYTLFCLIWSCSDCELRYGWLFSISLTNGRNLLKYKYDKNACIQNKHIIEYIFFEQSYCIAIAKRMQLIGSVFLSSHAII